MSRTAVEARTLKFGPLSNLNVIKWMVHLRTGQLIHLDGFQFQNESNGTVFNVIL